MVAEGGTGYGHCISIARSKVIEGPYEFDPLGPVITAKDDLSWPLQRSGHGALVHVGGDNYVMSFLCSRRINDGQHSPMGRETGLAQVVMTADGWIRQFDGAVLPPLVPCRPRSQKARSPTEVYRSVRNINAFAGLPVASWR